MHKKLRVAVVMGGASNEKEISLDSGRNVAYKLSSKKYEVIPLFVDKQMELYPLTTRLMVHNATSEIELELDRSTRIKWHDLPTIADFVFIGLHGGLGENGAVQGALEVLKMPYNGPGVLASSLCMDKYKTNSFLKLKGFSVPDHVLITKKEWICDKNSCLEKIKIALNTFPLIVKPHNDGCSVFVAKITEERQLVEHMNALFEQTNAHALIEEYIEGMELTVGVVGNDTPYAFPPSQSIAFNGVLSLQEKFLPGAGENQTPAPLPEAVLVTVKDTVVEAYKAIGCVGYSRIDCFYQNEKQSKTGMARIVILEINTLPALTPATCLFHQAAELNITPTEFIDLIISLGLEEYYKKGMGAVVLGTVVKEFEKTLLSN